MRIHREAEFSAGNIQTEMVNLWSINLGIIKMNKTIKKKKKKKKNRDREQSFKKLVWVFFILLCMIFIWLKQLKSLLVRFNNHTFK